jgi:AraC-like DNA-binding protein
LEPQRLWPRRRAGKPTRPATKSRLGSARPAARNGFRGRVRADPDEFAGDRFSALGCSRTREPARKLLAQECEFDRPEQSGDYDFSGLQGVEGGRSARASEINGSVAETLCVSAVNGFPCPPNGRVNQTSQEIKTMSIDALQEIRVEKLCRAEPRMTGQVRSTSSKRAAIRPVVAVRARPTEDTATKSRPVVRFGRLYHINDWERLAQEAHYSAPDFARCCAVSLRHLQRHFRDRYGLKVREWLNAMRLWRGMFMLDAQSSVKETAYELGFKQCSHFSRAFKEYHGISPSVIRVLRVSRHPLE